MAPAGIRLTDDDPSPVGESRSLHRPWPVRADVAGQWVDIPALLRLIETTGGRPEPGGRQCDDAIS